MPVELAEIEPQYTDLEHQKETSVLGMWVYLATEVLLFGGIITALLALRVFYRHDFEIASGRLNVLIGGINTLVLLGSSLTMAMAVHHAQKGDRAALRWLVFTALLGAAFLALKAYEYFADWRDGLVPLTHRFAAESFAGADRRHVELFLLFYFVLTGLHAVHLVTGIGLVGWVAARFATGDLPRRPAIATEVVGLYWHFVDMAWLFLLPLLYLSGEHHLSDLHF
jgi:cytochrome c oxidase subunit 3